ncbi:MAG: transglutaminase domain-containing protein, partial [Bacteroidota bacterium]
MKHTFIIFLFILYAFFAPKGYSQSAKVEKIATRITKGIEDDSLQFRAIFCWVTRRIKYDLKAFKNRDLPNPNTKTTLRRRKAVCAGYALLMAELCRSVDIPAFYLSGYTREGDFDPDFPIRYDDHAWNAVLLKGRWYLLDATWSSMSTKVKRKPISNFVRAQLGLATIQKVVPVHKPNDDYYLLAPEQMIVDHLPLLPMWQLLSGEVLMAVFEAGPEAVQQWIFQRQLAPKQRSAEIAYYRSLPEDKQWLWEGESSVSFHPLNAQAIGYRYVQYGLKGGTPSDTIDYLLQGIQYVRAAIAGNRQEHQARMKRNNQRKLSATKLLSRLQSTQNQFLRAYQRHLSYAKRQDKILQKDPSVSLKLRPLPVNK